ncbi:leucyl aminopeptidase [Candidatus Woesearchaeota archaeon]|jgi:leucyl aminopeptidase|nr:leucyl aminopeptidase [Candidatus Woesearchaeota archaeon]MBT4150786.1 leucyl aminopeptidase [Candidatus Woesearchaeota archaeon]MBT4247064.1 leucyl aminopeptidase [Candidatus Woesearchaeota archaeon]MBT4434081.1 leucyl aminopeptidase [Candidatus Woesearchaeota archaeon]MBT7332572.1 leucyl aminopeptidase [Candidatus Woesearchaeota archaeon]
MKINVLSKFDSNQDALVLGLFEEDKGNYSSLSKQLAQELAEEDRNKHFTRKFGQKYATRMPYLNYKKVIVLGLGKKKEITLERLRKLLGGAVRYVKGNNFPGLTTNIPALLSKVEGLSAEMIGRATAEGLILANYKFIKYLAKDKQEKNKSLASVSIQWDGTSPAFVKGLKTGRVIAESSNFVKDLVNESASVATSVYMEKQARKVASKHGKVKIKVLGKQELQKLGMGLMLGVNQGSEKPPRLIFLEYSGGGKEKPIALVGKGITFDSGGYNLKPTRYIEDMKTDMAGSAAVLGTIKVAAELGIKKNIIGVMAMCENMVSGHAQRPGDIVRAYNGLTVEIGNTDAEGRLVLADALSYTEKKYHPEVMIDLATLTGACVVALGNFTAAVISRDDELIASLKAVGETSGDRIWPLPFYEEFHDAMDADIADLNNIAVKKYGAGSITAGVFLSKFVNEKTKWAHLDIAGSAYWEYAGPYNAKGATGSGVRALSYYLLDN